MAPSEPEISLGGMFGCSLDILCVPLTLYDSQGMNEHAIYDIVGTKRQRFVAPYRVRSFSYSRLSYPRPSIYGLRKQWCPEIVDLIERMWAQEHNDRPTMSEVVEELERLICLW
jgi:mitogen-activated protein kinase kinase kinase 13